jgi:hypothetical protein
MLSLCAGAKEYVGQMAVGAGTMSTERATARRTSLALAQSVPVSRRVTRQCFPSVSGPSTWCCRPPRSTPFLTGGAAGASRRSLACSRPGAGGWSVLLALYRGPAASRIPVTGRFRPLSCVGDRPTGRLMTRPTARPPDRPGAGSSRLCSPAAAARRAGCPDWV